MAVLTPQNLLNVSLQNVYRPYNYTVRFNFPFGGNVIKDTILGYLTGDFMVDAASLPSISATTRTLKVMGRDMIIPNKIKNSGTWSCTFYMDELGTLKSRFEEWIISIDNFHNDMRSGGNLLDSALGALFGAFTGGETNLFGDIDILAGTFVGSSLSTKKYTLKQAYPINIGEVKLGDNMQGQVGEFIVEFAYNSIAIDEGIQIPGVA